MTLKPEQIRKLRDVDIATVDKSKLPDMSRVKLDPRLTKEERLTRILRTAKNPYCFRYGDTAVKLEFADDGPPLQDVMADFLIRQKSGL
ncbi:MAG: DUF6870 family protein [Ethanoligenens sp.]